MRLNDGDPGFKHQVATEPGGQGIRVCFDCAACSARCPVAGHLPGYDPRRLIHLALLGQRDQVLSSPLIWLCSGCHSCTEVCPQEVSFSLVLTAIKNIAARQGYAPPSAKITAELLAKQGRLLEVTEFENEKRADLGLPPVEQRPDHFQVILGISPEEEPQGGGA